MSGFMDTFFFLSLGITFVLILLLVYHFKQRLSSTENKCDTMFEIINGMVEEINSLKHVVLSQRQAIPPGVMGISSQNPIITHSQNNIATPNICCEDDECCDNTTNCCDDDDDHDDEDDDDDDDEDDDDDDDDDEDDDEDDDDDEDEGKQAETVDDGNKIEVSDNEEVEEIVIDELVPSTNNDETIDYNKMTLAKLRELVLQKGIVKGASKMKKSDIVSLLEEANE